MTTIGAARFKNGSCGVFSITDAESIEHARQMILEHDNTTVALVLVPKEKA